MLVLTRFLVALVVATTVPMAASGPPGEPLEPATVYLPAYLDTDPQSVFDGDIRTFTAVGITHGCDDAGRFFCPGDTVTRGQMAAFLVRAIDPEEVPGNSSTRFIDTSGTVFHADISRLAAAGVTTGCNPPTNDEFCPASDVTRGEMAAFLVRALGIDHPLPEGYTGIFTDDNGSIFEADIARLALAGISRGCNPPVNDRFCPNQTLSRQQMAAFLVRALDLDQVPVHPAGVTVERELSSDVPGTTVTLCHDDGTPPVRVRNAGWGSVYPRVDLAVAPSILTWSSGSYDATTDIWTTDPAERCATFQSGWNPRGVALVSPLSYLRITSPFGYRSQPTAGASRFHGGTDFGAPVGTDVYAAADGAVVTAGTDGGFGQTIGLRHAAGLSTRYSHLSSISVSVGQTVSAGEVIGKVGCTGICTGPHLHFETWEWDTRVDPMIYLR